jgi:hypothetical protein
MTAVTGSKRLQVGSRRTLTLKRVHTTGAVISEDIMM